MSGMRKNVQRMYNDRQDRTIVQSTPEQMAELESVKTMNRQRKMNSVRTVTIKVKRK